MPLPHDAERDTHLESGSALRPALFVRIAWPGEPVLVHSELGEIDIEGETHLGIGALGNISHITHADAGASDRVMLGITGIPADLMHEPFNPAAIGAEVIMRSGYLGPDRALIGGLRPVYYGFIDGPKINVARADGGRSIDLEIAVSGAENPRLILSAIHSDASAPAGDTLYRHLQVQVEEEPAWPA